MNTNKCVDMIVSEYRSGWQGPGNVEGARFESVQSFQTRLPPSGPPQAPRKLNDHLIERESVRVLPVPEENTIGSGTLELDPMGYFKFDSAVVRPFDTYSPLEEEPWIPYLLPSDSDSDSDHHDEAGRAAVQVVLEKDYNHLSVPPLSGPTLHPVSKLPEFKSNPSELFDSNRVLKKTLSPIFLDEIERKDMPITSLDAPITAYHECVSCGHAQRKGSAPKPLIREVLPLQSPALLSETSTDPGSQTSSSPTEIQPQPSTKVAPQPHSEQPPKPLHDGSPDHQSDPSNSSTSIVIMPDDASISRRVRPRNAGGASRKGIPKESKKNTTEYQARKHSCGFPGCGARFPRPDNLDRHHKTVHQRNLAWTCPVRGCTKVCTREDNGLQHLQMEHDSICRDCDQKFNHPKALHKHLLGPPHRT